MKTAASREAFRKQMFSGRIKTDTHKVAMHIYENHGTTTHDIRCFLTHQTATSRISELMDAGFVKVIGSIKIDGLTYSRYAFVLNTEEQNLLKEKRQQDKYESWLKQGLKNYFTCMSDALIEAIKEERKRVQEKKLKNEK